jgi:hypothetical protein
MVADKRPAGPTRTEGAKAAATEREKRLAAALRANLRRRKEQNRGRAEQPAKDDRPSGEDDGV